MKIVRTDVAFSDYEMQRVIYLLKNKYPFLEVGTFGKSVLGKSLYYLKLGQGETQVHYNAGHHALEWHNCCVLMKFVEEFCEAYATNIDFLGHNVKKLSQMYSYYIVPMLNPDGVDIVLNGLYDSNPYYEQINSCLHKHQNVQLCWNANIRGVDLNRNYPARWYKGKQQEMIQNISGFGPTKFGGEYSLSEPETLSLVNFTRQKNFKLVIAFHSQGEEIYYDFLGDAPTNSLKIANAFSQLNGYQVKQSPHDMAYGGYKDWFIDAFGRCGFTFETGLGKNPLPFSETEKIYNRNVLVLLTAPMLVATNE